MTAHSPSPGGTQAQALAAFALDTRRGDIPHEVLERARGHFLDVLGIALASSTFDFGRSVLAAGSELGSGTEAHAIGFGRAMPATAAALVNGTLAHGLDYDDTHIAAIYHASSPAFASALAAGEAANASGAEVLTAYLIAMEIGCRIAAGGAGEFHAGSLHPTALCGVFATAAAAARLRGATPAQLTSAMGLAGSQAGGILEIRDSWLKRFHPGWAAHAGLIADALGRAGFRGPSTVFEGEHGFFAAHLGRVPAPDKLPAHRLGSEWHALGIALKPYPCCHFIHGFVDCALALRRDVKPADVERIECVISPALGQLLAEPHIEKVRPPTVYAALFSVHYTVALALAKGRVDLAAFHDEPLDDPQVLALADRAVFVDDLASDFPRHFPGELRITLKDGRVLTHRVATSLGTPERPLSRAQIEEKFMANAGRALGAERAQQVKDAVWNIERLPRIGELLALCTAEGNPT